MNGLKAAGGGILVCQQVPATEEAPLLRGIQLFKGERARAIGINFGDAFVFSVEHRLTAKLWIWQAKLLGAYDTSKEGAALVSTHLPLTLLACEEAPPIHSAEHGPNAAKGQLH